MSRITTILALFFVFSPLQAVAQGNDTELRSGGRADDRSGGCGGTSNDLYISGVHPQLKNRGALSEYSYRVPKETDYVPTFLIGIWVGGYIEGDLRVAGSQDGGWEFWPGPLNPDGSPPDDCEPYNRIWVVSVDDVSAYEQTGSTTPDLAEWPVELGAGVIDGDGVPDNYNLAGGDRPLIFGHQTAFWVMNDVYGGMHYETGNLPIGLEVRVTAFAVASGEPALHYATFYRLELHNRSGKPLADPRFSLIAGNRLGFIGSDPARGLAYSYQEDNEPTVVGTPPAFGYDILSGADATTYYAGQQYPEPLDNPEYGTPVEYDNLMRGLWNDGTPMVTGGIGYPPQSPPGGDETTYAFEGDPEDEAFWSMVNMDGTGADADALGYYSLLSTSPDFSSGQNPTATIDLAILYAQGSDHLNSVTELKAASDVVQQLYDTGNLFVPSSLPPVGGLATPEPIFPDDGAVVLTDSIQFSWTSVAGTDVYRVDISQTSDFREFTPNFVTEASLWNPRRDYNPEYQYYWRVRAEAIQERSFFSETNGYIHYVYRSDWFDGGDSIVEMEYGGTPTCDDENLPGCDEFGGATVWHNTNNPLPHEDYYVSAGGGGGDLFRLLRYHEAAAPNDFEMRFTESCAKVGSCLGVYAFGENTISSVPFELWYIGDPADQTDDVRAIPFLNNEGLEEAVWPYGSGTNPWPSDDSAISDWVHFMMPDRSDGYDLFEAAANDFGGPGTAYDPSNDGDTQIDIDPLAGDDCDNQGYYAAFCYENQEFLNNGPSNFIYPIGRVVLADLARDGTPPPPGTTIRFVTNDPIYTGIGDHGPTGEQPNTFRLLPAYPNPFNPRTIIPFETSSASTVRITVYDILGRAVTTLVDGEMVAGRHEAVLDGSQLASGVYLIRLEAGGATYDTRKVLLLR